MNKEIFSAIIDSIHNEQIECYSFYPVSKQFMKICEHPGPHINNAIAYLANSSNSKSKKGIAILTRSVKIMKTT